MLPGYTADLRIDRHLPSPSAWAVSQLNNCTYRLNLHYQAAREAGIPRGEDRHPDSVVGDRASLRG